MCLRLRALRVVGATEVDCGGVENEVEPLFADSAGAFVVVVVVAGAEVVVLVVVVVVEVEVEVVELETKSA